MFKSYQQMRLERITSRDNSRLIHARKVREGRVPKQIFIEGRRLAEEALRFGLAIDLCFVSESFEGKVLLDLATNNGATGVELPDRLFASIADTKQPQGIILIAKRPSSSLSDIETRLQFSRTPVVVFLKEINNPSNLGAVLRTAEAAGAAGIIVSRNSADVFSPKALRGSMGATFRFPALQDGDLDHVLRWAKAAQLVPTAAAAAEGADYLATDWRKPRLLILGSEAHGIADAELEQIDEKVTIPMESGVESLNLAVSAGIILFEARRQNSNE